MRQTLFHKWLIGASLATLVLSACVYAGGLQWINRMDVTKITFLILAVFIWFSVKAGRCTYGVSTGRSQPVHAQSDTLWFVSDVLTSLGLLGTIIGLIYALTTLSSDPAQVIGNMPKMITGLSSAFVTTMGGLIGSILLRVQAHALDLSTRPQGER
jgi:hypothetical protein